MNETVQVDILSVKQRLLLYLFGLVGLLLGGACGYICDDYRLSLAWDKVELRTVKTFVEWYSMLCDKDAEL
jgi:hypothetical protein